MKITWITEKTTILIKEIRKNKPATILFFCLMALISNPVAADMVSVESFTRNTKTSITGYDADLKTGFSSHEMDDGMTVIVDIQLKDKKQITNRIDLSNPNEPTFELKVVNVKTGKPTSLSAKELSDLMVLKDIIGHAAFPAHSFMVRTLDLLLATDPDGENIDFSSSKIREELKFKDKPWNSPIGMERYTSFCYNLGQTETGEYTIIVNGIEQTIEEQVVVGPCYTGECLGRCGSLCNGKQNYTQECLNHDLCAGATGKNLGVCRDEWLAAADGYLFAPNCAKMDGQWTDNYGYVWAFDPEEKIGLITGTVNTGPCGLLSVTGKRNAQVITMTVTNPAPSPDCCASATYTGTVQCNYASGTWTNTCTINGSWVMQRDFPAAIGTSTLPYQAGPSPAEAR